MAQVSVRDLNKSYASVRALDAITQTFNDGEFFGLLGPSGSGKTTLLRTIAGFEFPDSGSIRIGDVPVEQQPVEKRQIGMVFQNYALFPNMSVADNVGFGLRVRKVGRAEEKRRIAQALELVQLGEFGDRRPHQLSGGQKQRVALARAIVTRPRVLLLDEPLSALDKNLRVDMQIELKRIQREVGITTVFVTHDQEEALTLSDRVGILKAGCMVQTGTPRAIYNQPSSTFVARFLGDANILTGTAEGAAVRLQDGTLIRAGKMPAALSDGRLLRLAIRPENMSLSSAAPSDSNGLNSIRGVLRQRIFSGAMVTSLLEWQGQTVKVLCRDDDMADYVDNMPLWLSWAPDRTLVFDEGA